MSFVANVQGVYFFDFLFKTDTPAHGIKGRIYVPQVT